MNDENNLSNSQTSYALEIAPANPDDVTVAKAQLDNAKANLANAQQTYDSRIITAPFDGQIGGLNAQIGQQVSSSDSLGTLITPQKVVNVTLNEVDAAKVQANDPVVLMFDAFPNLTINGVVNYIDPLGMVSQGVVNYDVQIIINDQNDQLKTGMTATAQIITATDSNVLLVPSSAVLTSGGRSYVLVPNGTSTNPSGAGGAGQGGGQFNYTSSTGNGGPGQNGGQFGRFGNASSTGAGFAGGGFGTSTSASSTRRYGGNFSSGSGTRQLSSATTNSTVHPVYVTTGLSNNTYTEITSGRLSEGQTIVVRTVTSAAASTQGGTSALNLLGGGRTFGGGGGARPATTGGSSARPAGN